MKCKKCGSPNTKVIYTRYLKSGYISRRRECKDCSNRFNTQEESDISDSNIKLDQINLKLDRLNISLKRANLK